MRSITGFIVSPDGERYNNKINVGDKELIVNSEIQNHEYVNRLAIVKSTPIINNTDIKVGDIVVVHHNVFRRWHNINGVEKNSKAWFSEDKYIVSKDQIYLYNQDEVWKPLSGFSFVQPLRSVDAWNNDIEHETKGMVKYASGNFNIGDVVGFTPFSKYEFIIDGVKLYRVYNKFITIKYECERNEKAYNPSWAKSS